MTNLVNPYHAGRPVKDPAMFFGRDDALIWIEQQITLDRRLLIVHGPDLIGKTSLIYRLTAFLPEPMHLIHFECKPHQDKTLPQAQAALAGELANELLSRGLVSPHQVDTASDSATAVKSLLQHATAALEAPHPAAERQKLLLVLDDVHRLWAGRATSSESLLDFVASLLTEVPSLQVLLTLGEQSYDQLNHPILLGAVTFRLGPLSSDAAQQLITRPSQGALRFDAGVTKRIADITSNHPYYLHLFCYSLYNCCARDGWINQSDIDRVLEILLTLPNQHFQAIWDQCTWTEQVTLSGLAGVKGAHGLITRQEVVNYLRRFDPRVAPNVILNALESLADRHVLVRMGALSYRFAVNLFRYWIERYTSPAVALAGANWDRLSTQLTARSAAAEVEPGETPSGDRESEEEIEQTSLSRSRRPGHSLRSPGRSPRSWVGRLSILGLAGTALIGMVLLALAFTGLLPAGIAPPTVTEATTQAAGFVSPTSSPMPTTPLLPTVVTPTRPLVVAHSLPAIVYMARGVGNSAAPAAWQLFLMNVDGSSRQQHTESGDDDITPVWSPDGQRIAFVSQRDGNREIYLIDADTLTGTGGNGVLNLTQHPAEDWTPAWSPDGRQIAFASNRQGNWEIFVVNADGTDLRQITSDGAGNLSPVWSPDGRVIAFASKRDGNWELYTMPAPTTEGQAAVERRRLTFSEGNDLSPLFSPQGDRLAFESNREGNVEVYVMSPDGSNQRNLSNAPSADDHGPVWSPDGQRLVFYSNREGNWDLFVMSAAGENVVNLTNTPDMDEQAPAWRP